MSRNSICFNKLFSASKPLCAAGLGMLALFCPTFATTASFAQSANAPLITQSTQSAPDVVTSIKPIHSLVSVVMDGVAEPKLLIDDDASPHGYKLKPSQAKALEEADMVVWVGEEIEAFLEKAVEEIASNASSLELMDIKGLNILKYRESGHNEREKHGHEKHDEDHKEEDHDEHKDDEHAHEDHDYEKKDHDKKDHHKKDHGEFDSHIWLSLDNAAVMVHEIAHELSELDRANAATYERNAEAYEARLEELKAGISKDLEAVKGSKFLVFHDAYQYFETSFGLSMAGAITLSPDTAPGAARLKELQEKLKADNISCLFSEPQFDARLVKLLKENTDASIAQLDPLGVNLEAGSKLYEELMLNMAANFKGCLG